MCAEAFWGQIMKYISGLVMLFVVVAVFTGCQNKKVEVPVQSYSLRSVYFDYDDSLIRGDASTAMQGNASYLKQNPNVMVTIEGNCDNRGTNEYNLALGHRRAQASKGYIMNLGVSDSRMSTVSYGEERPVCHQYTEECWQRNRRADFRK